MPRISLLLPAALLAGAFALGCGDQLPPTAPDDAPEAALKQQPYTATPIGNVRGVAVDINDAGQVAGTEFTVNDGVIESGRAFRWYKGTMTMLPTKPGAHGSSATGINNRGQVVGVSPGSGNAVTGWPHGVVWNRGVMTDLGALPGAVYDLSAADAINERGQIVGYSSSPVDF